MQKTIEKKWDLDQIYALAQQAKEAGDIDQAIKLSEKGIKEAESQKDTIWLSKFKLFTREMHSNNSDMHLSEVAVIVKNEDDITKIKGIGPSIAQKLHEAGYSNIEQLSMCSPKILAHVNGIGLETAKKYIRSAKEYIRVSNIPSIESSKSMSRQQDISEYTESVNINTDTKSYKKEIEDSKRINASKSPWFEKKLSFQRGTRSYPRIKKPKSSHVDLIKIEDSSIEPIEDSNIHPIEEEEEEIQDERLEEEYLSEIEEEHSIRSLKKGKKELTGKITAQSSISSNIEPKQNKEKVITEVAMNLEPKKEDILSKLRTMINNMIKAEAFEIIPQDAKEFKNILCKIDITLFKVISSENNRHAILIIPLKINPVQDTIVVSEEKVKYLAKLRKNLLLDAYLVNLKHISSIILENLVEKGEIFYFFQNHFRNNINMNKSISDEISLYSRAAQFKVYVNPILISDEEIQFIEKTLPFAYQRCSGIHFIHRSQLTKLLCFLEKKYQIIEEYSQEEPMYQKLEQIRCKTLKNVSNFSFPFIGFGILSVIIGVIKLDFLLPFFIEVSYGIIGIYIVLLGLLWYKYHIENKKTLVQLLTPFHQKSIKLDNASLEIIYQEFIDEDMLQFGYECFGKVTKHKLLNNIEEEKAERYDVQDVNTNYGEFFEKENSSEYNKEVDEFLNI